MSYTSRSTIKCVLCDRPSIGRKLCRHHYNQMARQKRLTEFPILGPEDVFDSRYTKGDGCWLWHGTKNGYGYGVFLLPGEVPVRAHRYAYERVHGPIPDGLVVMHSCDNPPCVNPAHLSLGTRDDNNKDMQRKRRNRRAENHHWGRLTDVQALEIFHATGESNHTLARKYGVDPSTISHIRAGRRRVVLRELC